jgi:hypothetical protein
MAGNAERDNASEVSTVMVRTEDGAWYELPAVALERARVTDPARLAELRAQIAAAGGAPDDADAPIALLSPETLAPHRVHAERAAALEAAAVAGTDDVAGFDLTFTGGEIWSIGGRQEWRVLKWTPNVTGGLDITPTVAMAPPPSTRFPDGATYRA